MKEIIKILNEFAKSNTMLFATNPTIYVEQCDFPAIAEKISQLDGWVRVGERLPGTSFEVLVTDGSRSAIASYDDLVGWGVMGAVYFEPTHWMPLPKLPSIPE